MKIEKTGKSLTSTSVGEASSRTSAGKTGGKTVSGSAGSSSTSVHLGATTAKIRSLESSVASSPVVDAAKVAEIKSAISEGRFQVDSAVVADRLLASAQELLGAGVH